MTKISLTRWKQKIQKVNYIIDNVLNNLGTDSDFCICGCLNCGVIDWDNDQSAVFGMLGENLEIQEYIYSIEYDKCIYCNQKRHITGQKDVCINRYYVKN